MVDVVDTFLRLREVLVRADVKDKVVISLEPSDYMGLRSIAIADAAPNSEICYNAYIDYFELYGIRVESKQPIYAYKEGIDV